VSSIKNIPADLLILDVWFSVRPICHDLVAVEMLDNGDNSLWKSIVPASELPELMSLQYNMRGEYLKELLASGGQA